MYYYEYLQHYGILGMKWGKRRTVINEKRANTLNRLKQTNPLGEKHYNEIREIRGQRAVNRILDIMGKHPDKSFKSASRQQLGEHVAKRVLLAAGIITISRLTYNHASKKSQNKAVNDMFDSAIEKNRDYNNQLRNAVDEWMRRRPNTGG